MPDLRHITRLAVPLLLLLHVGMVNHALREKSATWDEPLWIWQGMSYWHGDFRFSAEGGSLPQRLATLPLLFDRDISLKTWTEDPGATPALDRHFPFRAGNDHRGILARARLMMSLVSAGLCLAVFLMSRRAFGAGGGLVSLTLCAFSPVVLAHGGLVTVDIWSALFFLLTTHLFALAVERLTWRRLAGLCLATAGLVLGKTSSPLILPVWGAILLARLLRGGSWRAHLPPLRLAPATTQGRMLAQAAGLLLAVGAFTWGAIWTAYHFRSAPLAEMTATDQAIHAAEMTAAHVSLAERSPALARLAGFTDRHRLLPAPFLHGFMRMVTLLRRWSFLDGEMHLGGRWDYFPRCFLYKTPIPALLLLLATATCLAINAVKRSPAAGESRLKAEQELGGTGCGLRIQTRSVLHGKTSSAPSARLALHRAFPHVAFIIVYGIFSLTTPMNIGERHLLPLYAQAFVLTGVLVRMPRAWPRLRRIVPTVVALLLGWLAIDAVRSHPHYLAYFSPVGGGPANGYHHLVDSNLDWGQDYLGLKQWLDENNPGGEQQAYFLYFGDAHPDDYRVPAQAVESFQNREARLYPLRPGLYAVSATMLQHRPLGLDGYTPERFRECHDRLAPLLAAETPADPAMPLTGITTIPGEITLGDLYPFYHRWRCAQLCNHLATKKSPVAMVGYSILVYEVDTEDLAEAF